MFFRVACQSSYNESSKSWSEQKSEQGFSVVCSYDKRKSGKAKRVIG